MNQSTPRKIRPGRQFEQVVEAIQATTWPSGTIVRSPDFPIDQTTGKEVEVDVTVRYSSPGGEVLIVFQCQDRGRKAGPSWIRELHVLKHEVGANLVVGVCAAGFTAPAISKARHYGIPLHTLEVVPALEVGRWVALAQRSLDLTICRLNHLRPHFVDGEGAQVSTSFAKDRLAALQTEWQTSPFAVDDSTGSPVTLSDLVSELVAREGKFGLDELSVGGPSRKVQLSFEPSTVWKGETDAGVARIARLELGLEFVRRAIDMPVGAHKLSNVHDGTAAIHPHWQADLAKAFPDGGGIPLVARIGTEVLFDIRSRPLAGGVVNGDRTLSSSQPIRPGPNKLCHCGSGKKYKKCHMAEDQAKAGR